MNTASAIASVISSRTAHIAAILLVAGCAQSPLQTECPKCPDPVKPVAERASYLEASFASLPGWREAALLPSLRAFLAGCAKLAGPVWSRPCGDAAAVADEQGARRFFETAFLAYSVSDAGGSDSGLVTGYYEPVVEGRRSSTGAFRFPIHGVPDDLIVVDLTGMHPELRNLRLRGRIEGRRLLPYHSRAEIDERGGAFPAPVIAWAADPVELFFLQIQGSGQIELGNGSRIRVGYADQNGHPYRSLGRHLIERGELALEQASMQGIKAWAAANPQRLQQALNHNASYVFFRELPAAGGPIGSLGVALSAEYSIAVDRRHIPLGAPVYLATTWPLSSEPLERLVAAQDTGGAIRGPVRADFFWGTGTEAGAAAGRMRQSGRMWLLWPRGAPPPAGD